VTADPPRPLLIPAEVAGGVQRIALAGRVVIHHVLTGEFRRDIGVRPVPAGRALEHLGLVSAHPFQVRANGLTGQQRACPLQDVLLPELLGERFDLGGGTGIDAVQNRRT